MSENTTNITRNRGAGPKRPAKKWGRGYAMVPGWLVLKQPTPNALTVYVHLAMHGTYNPGDGTYEQCRPSKKTLAKGDEKRGYPGCGLSEQVIGRALRELEELRAIRGEPAYAPDGSQLPNVYRLIFGEVHEEEETPGEEGVSPVIPPAHATSSEEAEVPGEGMTSDTPRGDQTDTPPEVSPVIHNQEPLTQNPTPRTAVVALSEEVKEPPRSDVDSLPREPEAESGGDSESISETERNLLNAAVEQAVALRSGRDGWSQQAIVAAMQAQLDEFPPARIAAVIVDAARDTSGTQYPGRIGYLLKQAARPVSAPPAGLAQVDANELGRKHLALGTPMCKVDGHRGEPAHNCNRCASDRKGAQVDAPSVLDAPPIGRAEALALARQNAAKSSTRPVRLSRGPWVPPTAPDRESGLDRLRAAADQLVEVAS